MCGIERRDRASAPRAQELPLTPSDTRDIASRRGQAIKNFVGILHPGPWNPGGDQAGDENPEKSWTNHEKKSKKSRTIIFLYFVCRLFAHYFCAPGEPREVPKHVFSPLTHRKPTPFPWKFWDLDQNSSKNLGFSRFFRYFHDFRCRSDHGCKMPTFV